MISAYSNIFVRYLLGNERDQDLLISFINAVKKFQDYRFRPNQTAL
jgi:hypothetical protein